MQSTNVSLNLDVKVKDKSTNDLFLSIFASRRLRSISSPLNLSQRSQDFCGDMMTEC